MLAPVLFNNFLFAFLLCISSLKTENKVTEAAQQEKILVFTKTNGYHHASIADGLTAIKKLGKENNFGVDATTDSLQFSDANLRQYKVIVFLSTTGNVLGTAQQTAMEHFIHNGGGFVGIHAAADCEYDWPWYGRLVGGYFKNHPNQQKAKLLVINKDHLATKHLPGAWERRDEWYNYKEMTPCITVLIKIDETSYSGGEHKGNHPMAWYQDFESGRSFYTGLGHTKESFSEPLFLQHLLGGIKWAMHRN